MKALVVHNDEEVKDVFLASDEKALLKLLKKSEYWEEIKERLCDIDEDIKISSINLDLITEELFVEGDSEHGFSLCEPIM